MTTTISIVKPPCLPYFTTISPSIVLSVKIFTTIFQVSHDFAEISLFGFTIRCTSAATFISEALLTKLSSLRAPDSYLVFILMIDMNEDDFSGFIFLTKTPLSEGYNLLAPESSSLPL